VSRSVLPTGVAIILLICFMLTGAATIFWSMGAWHVQNDQLDGAATCIAIAAPLIGISLVLTYSDITG